MFLEDVKVIDLSRVLAGPLATQILGDMGAEILKIEPPGGDDTRHWGPPFQKGMAAYFQSCNRNKRSRVLDLKSKAGKEELFAHIAEADVVVDNYPPKVRARLGLTPTDLARHNPNLISLTITGYRGSRADEPGYDVMIQAESGLMGITGPPDGTPYKVGVAVVDVLTGMMAANGVLAALYRRARSGEGAVLEVSLYQTALFSLVNVATNHFVSGEPSRRWGNAHANLVPYQEFRTRDRDIIIAVGNDSQFQRLCDLLEIRDQTLRAMSNPDRVTHRQRVVDRLAQAVAGQEAAPLLDQLRAAKIPAAPILKPEEAFAAARTWDPTAVIAVGHNSLGRVEMVANPIRSSGMRRHHGPPPELDDTNHPTPEDQTKDG